MHQSVDEYLRKKNAYEKQFHATDEESKCSVCVFKKEEASAACFRHQCPNHPENARQPRGRSLHPVCFECVKVKYLEKEKEKEKEKEEQRGRIKHVDLADTNY